MISVICHNERCQTKFPARRRSAKYCSNRCRDMVAAKRKSGSDAPRPKVAVCKYCGKTFSISSKGRKPSFCSDSHRVCWHNNVRNAAIYQLTHLQRGKFARISSERAHDFIEGRSAQWILDQWQEWGYHFDGRQFVYVDENPTLL